MEIWEKPQMQEMTFAANEYVSACGVSQKTVFNHFNLSDKWLYLDTDGDADSFTTEFNMDLTGSNEAYYNNSINTTSKDYFDYMLSPQWQNRGWDHRYVYDVDDRDLPGYEPCTESINGGEVDLTGIDAYDGWWTDNGDASVFGKIKLWWNDRLHVALVNVIDVEKAIS